MREILLRKFKLREAGDAEEVKDKTPQQLVEMMWQLTLDAWAFKENLNAEPRLQRHVVVLNRRGR